MIRAAVWIETAIRRIGAVFGWGLTALMVLIVAQVVLRKVFGWTSLRAEELQWHLYGAAMLVGLAYAYVTDSHVRIDFVQQRFGAKTRAVIELAGIGLLLGPFAVGLIVYSLPFVASAWTHAETSQAGTGLPCQWLIKGFIPGGCGLLLLAALAKVLRAIAVLRGESGALAPAPNDHRPTVEAGRG